MFLVRIATLALTHLRAIRPYDRNRILDEMTAQLREHSAAIRSTFVVMADLDLLFAKANFAGEFRCVIPKFGPAMRLIKARHPLLEDVLKKQRKQVVPVTLMLEGGQRTLLISGPNTGGKTVSLKTVGLLSLMAQSGLPVPCESAEFPVFTQVLADVGDKQSIEQSLSSFSSHISQIRDMIDALTPDSLVLMDELGRATDPEEGGALGLAVLDHFRRSGCFTLASTHLLAMKVYGGNTEGVVNASMGFDEQTLEPTYVLRIYIVFHIKCISTGLPLRPHYMLYGLAFQIHSLQTMTSSNH